MLVRLWGADLVPLVGPEFVCVKPDTYARYVKKGQLHFDPFQ